MKNKNLRGFKETFKPLIKSQDKVKESIDNQQNAMIKQLQENQLALTKGLDKNRLAITQGFDKMDEIKKWDLQQLPGYEAIEEPKVIEEPEGIEEDENPEHFVAINDFRIINSDEPNYQDPQGEKSFLSEKEIWMVSYLMVTSTKINANLILLTQMKDY